MYGEKAEKQARLEKMAALVAQAPAGITRVQLAQALGVARSTIHKDLVILEQKGILLAEDDAGRLVWPNWAE